MRDGRDRPAGRLNLGGVLVWSGAIVISMLLHVGGGVVLALASLRVPKARLLRLRVRVNRLKPKPPKKAKAKKPKPAQPKKAKRPKKPKKFKLRRRTRKPPPKPRKPPPPPPPNQAPPKNPPKEQAKPVFGVTKASVGKGKGPGMTVRVGNTLMKDPEKKFTPASKVRPYVAKAPVAPKPAPKRRVFRPVPVFEVDENPRERRKVRAVYPEGARRQGIEAVVTLSVEIRRSGRVRNVRVISVRPRAAQPFAFGPAAVRALKRYRFHPARYRGRSVDIVVRYVYRFELEG